MHLSVLIETMRREGYELQVGQPQVIIKERELLPKLNIRHDRTNGTLSLRHRSGVHLEMGLKGLALSAEF